MTGTPLVTSPIANKYGGSWLLPSGTKVGGYVLRDSQGRDLVMSGQMQQFLLEVSEDGGHGLISAIMDSHPKGNPNNPKDHRSGNKVDIGLGAVAKDQKAIIKMVTPVLKHPAVVHVSFEGLSNSHNGSIAFAKDTVNKMLTWYPDLKSVQSKIITNWGWTYVGCYAPHLDICINPEKLRTIPKG
jgi:hypothetical protein